jgi:hypothetical protein
MMLTYILSDGYPASADEQQQTATEIYLSLEVYIPNAHTTPTNQRSQS